MGPNRFRPFFNTTFFGLTTLKLYKGAASFFYFYSYWEMCGRFYANKANAKSGNLFSFRFYTHIYPSRTIHRGMVMKLAKVDRHAPVAA